MTISRPQSSRFRFPPVEQASPEGLLAIGGDLSSERLLAAYRQGIFPWYNTDQPILWWAPDPRLVLFPEELKISRSLKKLLKKKLFTVSFDIEFAAVMRACAEPRERGGIIEDGSWISEPMIQAYTTLHHHQLAHSVEVWQDGELVGGLYGVAVGGCFFGESMFSRATNASKVALVYLVAHLIKWGYTLIDCQITSEHLLSLGAREIPRHEFMHRLQAALSLPGNDGRWHPDPAVSIPGCDT